MTNGTTSTDARSELVDFARRLGRSHRALKGSAKYAAYTGARDTLWSLGLKAPDYDETEIHRALDVYLREAQL